jgi:DNA-binding NtrC family response regulator
MENRFLSMRAGCSGKQAAPLGSGAGILVKDKKERSDRERKLIETALAECRGRIAGPAGAAAKLGIPPQTLDSKIASLGIDKSQFKTRSLR